MTDKATVFCALRATQYQSPSHKVPDSLCQPPSPGSVAVTLGWAPGQGGAALPSLENPDSGLLRWSCQNSQKRTPLEAAREKTISNAKISPAELIQTDVNAFSSLTTSEPSFQGTRLKLYRSVCRKPISQDWRSILETQVFSTHTMDTIQIPHAIPPSRLRWHLYKIQGKQHSA